MTTTNGMREVDLVDYDEAVARYDPVFGIEVHVELGTRTKMFCPSIAVFGDEPNTAVSPVSLGLPGALPVVNGTAVEYAIRIGLALNCSIAETCRFARKNYFYPDVPKNFQTSQYDEPIAHDGWVDVELEDGTVFRVEIERAHMEEDAGKNTHVGGEGGRIHGATYSLVDYNRAGVPLVEIVTRPVAGAGARAPEVARAYVQTLRDMFRALGVSEARMERGNVRADVNVSMRPSSGSPLGTRTETKNVNSIRFVMAAIEYEARRQVDLIEDGGTVVQETRLFDPDKGVTRSMRSKEDAHDYRYFPDPDLLPLELDDAFLEEARASLPELPDAKRKRYEEVLGISAYNADVLTADVETARWFEAMLAEGAQAKAASNWVMSELFGALNRLGKSISESPVSPKQAAELVGLVQDGTLSGSLAKQVFEVMLETGQDAGVIVEERGLKQTSDTGAIEAEIAKVMEANPDKVAEYRGGKDKLFGFFVGQTMRAMAGKANPAVVNDLLKKALDA